MSERQSGCMNSENCRHNSSCTSTRVYKIKQLVYMHFSFKNDLSPDRDSSEKQRTTGNSHNTVPSSETAEYIFCLKLFKLDWTLHQKVIVSRKPAWEKHKLTRHFNLSLLENSSVIELKLSLTFTNVFPIGAYLTILNKFVSRPGKHRRIFILWSSNTAKP